MICKEDIDAALAERPLNHQRHMAAETSRTDELQAQGFKVMNKIEHRLMDRLLAKLQTIRAELSALKKTYGGSTTPPARPHP